MLLQIAIPCLLQIAYYKLRQFYYKLRQLLQISTHKGVGMVLKDINGETEAYMLQFHR